VVENWAMVALRLELILQLAALNVGVYNKFGMVANGHVPLESFALKGIFCRHPSLPHLQRAAIGGLFLRPLMIASRSHGGS